MIRAGHARIYCGAKKARLVRAEARSPISQFRYRAPPAPDEIVR